MVRTTGVTSALLRLTRPGQRSPHHHRLNETRGRVGDIDNRGTASFSDDLVVVSKIVEWGHWWYRFDADDVAMLDFTGGPGDDEFENTTTLPSFASGGPGDDVLIGGNGMDLFRGGLDDDVLRGNGGADRLFGEDGFDTLDGGRGNDWLVAGYDGFKESVTGGPGRDVFVSYLHVSGANWRSITREDWEDFDETEGDAEYIARTS